uniref:Uncharacterized protein n=1 Tax=Rhizophora mucronata TaxID=61149 RepID=A0A2P2KCX2_RHIMU
MEPIWRPFVKLPARYYAVWLFFFFFLLAGALVSTRIRDSNVSSACTPSILDLIFQPLMSNLASYFLW